MAVINGGYKEIKLSNGLVVAMQTTPTQTVGGLLRMNSGSSHEAQGEEGMAHFLEHCLCTAGSKRLTPCEADDIRGLFGYFNASTNAGRTNFVGSFLAEDLEPWLAYTSDHVFSPRFDEERVNGERKRVLREIADAKSSPQYLLNVEFDRIFYRGHPKATFTLGKEEVVKNVDLDKIKSFHSQRFHPNNGDLILVGGLPNNTDELVERYFGHLTSGQSTRRSFPLLGPLEDKVSLWKPAPEMLNPSNPDESSAILNIAFTGPVERHEDAYAVRTMNNLLGGGINSLLYQNLGLKKGLGYQIGSGYNGDYNAGEFRIKAIVPAKRITEAIDSIFDELKTLKSERVDEKAISHLRRLAQYKIAETLESNGGHVSAIEAKLDDGLTPEQFIEGYNRVTPDRVLDVANKYLPDKDHGTYVMVVRDPLLK